VTLAPNQTAACPTGFATAAPVNLVEGPNTSNACACGACAIGTQPTCENGAIPTFYDVHGITTGTCGSAGTPPSLANDPAGACDTDQYTGNEDDLDLKFVPPGPSGGACTSTAAPTGNITYAAQDRECTPDSASSAGCSGGECTPTLPSPYLACVAQAGSVACPAGSAFTQQHVVGTSVTLSCSACACNVTASCSGKVEFFTDKACTMGELDLPADGTCNAGPPLGAGGLGGTSFGSYKYVANAPANVACTASGTTATGVALANEQTICCVP
jgi:hypothetical protein